MGLARQFVGLYPLPWLYHRKKEKENLSHSTLAQECVPDRPYKILLVQVGTLSFSHLSFGASCYFIFSNCLVGGAMPPKVSTSTSRVTAFWTHFAS